MYPPPSHGPRRVADSSLNSVKPAKAFKTTTLNEPSHRLSPAHQRPGFQGGVVAPPHYHVSGREQSSFLSTGSAELNYGFKTLATQPVSYKSPRDQLDPFKASKRCDTTTFAIAQPLDMSSCHLHLFELTTIQVHRNLMETCSLTQGQALGTICKSLEPSHTRKLHDDANHSIAQPYDMSSCQLNPFEAPMGRVHRNSTKTISTT